jgi:ribosomal-protein-alanine N-acetyltransferase
MPIPRRARKVAPSRIDDVASNATIALRSYTPEDFETLYEIDQVCYEPAIAYSRRELSTYLRFPGADCVLVEAAVKVVGFCLTSRQGPRGHIITIDVLEEFRRRGIGAALLAEAERRLAANRVLEIGLETETSNQSAIAFWQKHGYRTRGVWKGYYPGGRDAFAMSKSLATSAAASKARD